MLWANLGRIGLDFWDDDRNAARNTSYFTNSRSLTVPGPAGAVPTVRFQMMRQAVQDAELRLAIVRACLKMPEDARKPYRALLDEFGRRVACGRDYLSQQELGYGWQKYVVEMQQTAAELCGVKTSARWDAPPQ